MKKRTLFLLILLIMFMFIGCQSRVPHKGKSGRGKSKTVKLSRADLIKLEKTGNAARNLLHENKIKEALEKYHEMLKIDPHDVNALEGQLLCLFLLKRIDEAERTAKHILEIYPDNGRALVIRGQILMRKERMEEAGKYIKKAHSLHPLTTSYNLELANYYIKTGDNIKAIKLLKPLLKQNLSSKDEGLIHLTIGNSYSLMAEQKEKGNNSNSKTNGNLVEDYYRKAAKHIEHAMKKGIKKDMCHYILMVSYSNLGKHEKSLKSVTKYLKANPELSQMKDDDAAIFYNNAAWVYHRTGDYDKALKYLKLSLAKNPNQPKIYKERAFIFFEVGEIEKAKADLYTWKRINKRSSLATNDICDRAVILFLEGKKEKAIQMINNAVSSGDNEALLDRAVMNYNSGKKGKAKEDFTEFLKFAKVEDRKAVRRLMKKLRLN